MQLRYEINIADFSKIPGSPIAYWVSKKSRDLFSKYPLLSTKMDICQGMKTADNERFVRYWYEISENKIGNKWFPYNKGGDFRRWYGNRDFLVNWENNGAAVKAYPKAVIRNERHFFDEGLTWSLISSANFGIRYSPQGAVFDGNGSMIFPGRDDIYYTLGFLASNVVTQLLSFLSATLTFEIGQLSKLPYKKLESDSIDETVNSNISFSKTDWDSYETSWDFKKHPLI